MEILEDGTNTEFHERAKIFIEAVKNPTDSNGKPVKSERSPAYLEGYDDGIMDFANHLDGRI